MRDMQNKKINLTVNPQLYSALMKKAAERAMSAQEYILDSVRDRVFAPPAKKSNAGRPKSSDDKFLDMFSRKR